MSKKTSAAHEMEIRRRVAAEARAEDAERRLAAMSSPQSPVAPVAPVAPPPPQTAWQQIKATTAPGSSERALAIVRAQMHDPTVYGEMVREVNAELSNPKGAA
jgi:hypothetical protein